MRMPYAPGVDANIIDCQCSSSQKHPTIQINALTSIPPVVINDCSVSYSHSIDSLTPERKYFFKLAFLSRLTLTSQEFLLKKVSSPSDNEHSDSVTGVRITRGRAFCLSPVAPIHDVMCIDLNCRFLLRIVDYARGTCIPPFTAR